MRLARTRPEDADTDHAIHELSPAEAWSLIMAHTDGIDVARRIIRERFAEDAERATAGNVGVLSVEVDADMGAIVVWDV